MTWMTKIYWETQLARLQSQGLGKVKLNLFKFVLFTVYLLNFPELLPSTFVFDIMFDTFWSHPTQFHLSSAWTPWLHQVTSVAPPATGLGSVAPAASAAGHPLGTHWRPQRPPAPAAAEAKEVAAVGGAPGIASGFVGCWKMGCWTICLQKAPGLR